MEKYYHFTEYENLESILSVGLIPSNGRRSMSVDDERKAVYLSKGKLSTILMYFAFKGFYESYKGVAGDELLEQATTFISHYEEILKNREARGITKIDRRMEKLEKNYKGAKATIHQISNIKQYQSFEKFWGDGVYLCISGIENVKYDNSDFHNCWVDYTILPENISVLILKNKETGESIDSKQEIIHYLMATSELDDLYSVYEDTIGINDYEDEYQAATKVFRDYYESRKTELDLLRKNFELLEIPLKEYMMNFYKNNNFEEKAKPIMH